MLSIAETITIVFLGLIPFALMVVSIADLMNREYSMWEKVLWMMVIVFLAILGPVIYLIFNRGVFTLNAKKHP